MAPMKRPSPANNDDDDDEGSEGYEVVSAESAQSNLRRESVRFVPGFRRVTYSLLVAEATSTFLPRIQRRSK